MGQALYRKYRSKSLNEIVGQEHITKTLEQALKQGRISHAYLFTGPRGVGKTSIARIWAHEINGLPYTDDSTHLDIIEIDAASNRRIDEIRELRDKVYVAPTSVKYKVYIIDEVHMLTREAFNALLKTLEEPPAHAVFILATTDAHKLPDTIVSRTQRFSFKPVGPDKVIDHLKYISKAENIKISDDALRLLANHGEGSFRDSISLLDQARGGDNKIEAEDIRRLLGIPPEESLQTLLRATLDGADSATLMNTLTQLYDKGYQAAIIAKLLGHSLRAAIINDNQDSDHGLTLLSKLIEVPAAHDPERLLEIVLLQARPQTATTETPKPIVQPEKAKNTQPDTPAEQKSAPKPANTDKAAADKPKKATPNLALNEEAWPAILKELKQRHNTLYGVVRMAEPNFSEKGKLKLSFAFAFHQKRIKENSNQQKLADIIHDLTGQTVTIECLLDKAAKPPKSPSPEAQPEPAPKAPDNNNLTAISNIFGEAELLES
ncbi:MAG: DNA polymerase III subunit gamma/tau [Patescibacteria group bacterium]